MQKTTQTLQESNPKAFAACLKSVCDAMTQGPNAIGIAQKYKGQLGFLLSNPVEQMVGAEFAPQVIGELVELPHHQIVALMQDNTQFTAMVNLAFYCVKGEQDAAGSDMCNTSMASTNESMAAATQSEAPVASWDFMYDIHSHAKTQQAKIVPTVVEQEKKQVFTPVTKPNKAAGNKKVKKFQYKKLAFYPNEDKLDFLRRQGVHFNAEQMYFNCINCEVELNFTSDVDKALAHCNKYGHQLNRFHNLKQRYGGKRGQKQ